MNPSQTPVVPDWKPQQELMRIPAGFFPRLAHSHADIVYMGWYGPIVGLLTVVSSTFYLLYRGVIWCIDKALSFRRSPI